MKRAELRTFFRRLAERLLMVLVPGAHVFIATNPLVSYLVYEPFISSGFEKRGEIIRAIHTLRGGDRPKNTHKEFAEVSVMPKSCWEPWGLFRKPCQGRVQDNLRKWKTGGLRRISEAEPFKDLVSSSPARGFEREIATERTGVDREPHSSMPASVPRVRYRMPYLHPGTLPAEAENQTTVLLTPASVPGSH